MHLLTLAIRSITGIFILAILFGIMFYSQPIYFSVLLFCIALYILFYEWPQLRTTENKLVWFSLGTLYICIPFFLLIFLNQSPHYHTFVPLLFIIAFAHDTGSYIIGSCFGKHKIAPRISPGKTWEGCCGGFMFTLLTLLGICWYFQKPFNALVLVLPLIITTIATTGDLFESWLKRRARLKDSGFLLPGHGGLLDRFDSILPLAVLGYLVRNYFFK